jgi:hypothetical protein
MGFSGVMVNIRRQDLSCSVGSAAQRTGYLRSVCRPVELSVEVDGDLRAYAQEMKSYDPALL